MKTIVSYAWKTVACAVAYFVGSAVGGALATALGAGIPSMPGTRPAQLALFAFLASLVLGVSLGPLASGLRARYLARFGALAFLAYLCLGVNTALETTIFTTYGGAAGMLVIFLPSTLACTATAAALFRSATPPDTGPALWSRFRAQHDGWSWAWRLAAAVVAFPVVYLVFGMVAGPFVVEAYRKANYGLTLPGWGQIIPMQFLRSTLFLLASVPAIALWRGSRPRLALSLGLASYAFIGLFGMLQAYWLPATIRLAHGLEIAADSFAYAAVIVLLLAPSAPASAVAAASAADTAAA